MTFYVKTGNAIFNKELKDLFESRGYVSSNKFPVDIVFLSGESAYYRNHFDLKKSGFVNVIKDQEITHKDVLYRKFQNETFIPKTADYPTELPDKFLKIVKPAHGFAGKGIRIVETKPELIQWINDWDPKEDWIVQDYIKTPALKDGHKFHLRVHVLVVGARVFLCRDMRYYVAKQPYVQGNWNNADIHDTHWNPAFNYIFPRNLPDGWVKASITGIENIVRTVFNGIKLKPDWNGKNAYYIFGLDIMFDKKKPILLEVNDKVGLTEKAVDILLPGVLDILNGTIPDSFKEVSQ